MDERNVSADLAQLTSRFTNYMADRRGAPMLLGALLVLLNFLFQFVPGLGWFSEYNVLLHLGVLTAIVGFLLASAL